MNARSVAFRTITSWPGNSTAADCSGSVRVESDCVESGRLVGENPSRVSGENPARGAGEKPAGLASKNPTSAFGEKENHEWARWAAAVNLMASGDYACAWLCFSDLSLSDNREIAGLANAARASGLRQLGEHAAAVDLDDLALSTAGVALLDGLIGRAADEIGLGNPARCRDYLVEADRVLDTVPEVHLRGRTRIGWVTAEAALMQCEPAVDPAQWALDAARAMQSPRHILKSLLIRGVAMKAVGDPAGDAELASMMRKADEWGVRTLVWPAALALEDDLPEDLRRRAVAAVTYIAAHLPPGRFDTWNSANKPIGHRSVSGVHRSL